MSSVIIFGGSRGIGKMLSTYLVTRGNQVTVSARDTKTLRKFKKHIVELGQEVNIVAADITHAPEVERVFKRHKDTWGRNPDVVINSAALQGPIGDSWSVSLRDWDKTLKVNLLGSFIVSRVAIQRMVKAGSGAIIMFSGGGACYGRPNFSAYAASKAGVLRMVETMAEELRLAGYPQITINAVAPGSVKTRMTQEVLKAGSLAGQKAMREAAWTLEAGGTSPKKITDLINFLMDARANKGLSGRLIHVRESYKSLIRRFGARIPDAIGKIRRI